MMKKTTLLCLAVIFLLLPVAEAFAISLGVAGDYNVFVFEDFTINDNHTEGRLAVGGNASLTSTTVGGGCLMMVPGQPMLW